MRQLEENEYFSQAINLQSDANVCGTAACKDAELTAAVGVYERILKLDPFNKLAYYDIGVIYTDSGQDSVASIAFQKALPIDPNYFPALYNLAYLDAEGGNSADAVALYRRATRAGGIPKVERARAYFNLGYLEDLAGNRTLGNAAFSQSVWLDSALVKLIPARFKPPTLKSTTTQKSSQ